MNDGSRPRLAWLIVALLAPVALLNYLDRQMAEQAARLRGELEALGFSTGCDKAADKGVDALHRVLTISP